MLNIDLACYGLWYRESVSANLTKEVKIDLLKRIDELSLSTPIWTPNIEITSEDFPELARFSKVRLTGRQLYAIMDEIIADLRKNQHGGQLCLSSK